MSPEQIDGSEISGATDQFALGVIAYEVLTGTKPFQRRYHPGVDVPNPEPASRRPRVRSTRACRKGPAAVLTKAMAKLPADRFENCEAFVNALANASGGDTGLGPD